MIEVELTPYVKKISSVGFRVINYYITLVRMFMSGFCFIRNLREKL